MARFTNQASLTYNGNVVRSNTTVGDIVGIITVSKESTKTEYNVGDNVTYIITLRNSGTTDVSGLNVTDNLGNFQIETENYQPLTYVDESARYYVNGELQTPPVTAVGADVTFQNIRVPAGGNATIVYDTTVNEFAPLGIGDNITNRASVTGAAITEEVSDDYTLAAAEEPILTITKYLNPMTVPENGQITYTFVIQNFGNTETSAEAADGVVLTDTFTPPLNPISVALDGTPLTEGTQYNYDPATGLFTTVGGQLTVPAAQYERDETTGVVTTTPGTLTLTVTGTV